VFKNFIKIGGISMIYENLIKELSSQENELQFTSFSNMDAVKIGMFLYQRALNEEKAITIDITRNGQQLFHVSLPGTSADNDSWILRKNKIVNRFQMSSYRMGTILKASNTTLEEKFNLSSIEYAPHGGSFPIIIKNTGVIGTITVSGLAQAEDHEMVTDAIKDFLK